MKITNMRSTFFPSSSSSCFRLCSSLAAGRGQGKPNQHSGRFGTKIGFGAAASTPESSHAARTQQQGFPAFFFHASSSRGPPDQHDVGTHFKAPPVARSWIQKRTSSTCDESTRSSVGSTLRRCGLTSAHLNCHSQGINYSSGASSGGMCENGTTSLLKIPGRVRSLRLLRSDGRDESLRGAQFPWQEDPVGGPCAALARSPGLLPSITSSARPGPRPRGMVSEQLRDNSFSCRNNKSLSGVLLEPPCGPTPSVTSTTRFFSTRSLHGRMFWRRRPREVPMRRWNWRSKWLEGRPRIRGICTKVTIKSPKKPNSGNRKVARVKLINGRTVLCYIPGIGHNLQTHSVVLVRGRRTRDLIGCNYKLVRGVFDLLPVKDKMRRRSIYGVKKPLKPNKWANTPERPWKRVYTDEMRRRYFFRTGVDIPAGEPVPHIPLNRKFPPFPIKGFGRRGKAA
ncbi:unnamed protein product [Amoebophrya sp. A120]|nr:unnamed protein product [Amoebophrya sp. A120]|eukprot:GSA120T00020495001.1